MNKELLVISAPSGAGKSTIIKKLLERSEKYIFSISTTTRQIRGKEKDGIDYYFTSKEEFRHEVERDSFIEWAEVHGNLYGTSKKEIDRIVDLEKTPILDIDVQGAVQLKKNYSQAVLIMLIPPSRVELEKRLRGRGNTSDADITVRMANAGKELRQYNHFDYIVVNDELDVTVKNVENIFDYDRFSTENMKSKIEKLLEEF